REFMHNGTRMLAPNYGIRQLVVIGPGIPTKYNLDEVAQSVAPAPRTFSVDNAPTGLVHAQTLLRSTGEGRTASRQIDRPARDPAAPALPAIPTLVLKSSGPTPAERIC
ncbi:SAM-dependent methyltransferase, partial [Streptomyces violaceusniger]|uniref:SAM-dependent methyltransferase n=1 Tax=Streptomyces violaceusniger TaxID=68280 RepID=UPI000A425C60